MEIQRTSNTTEKAPCSQQLSKKMRAALRAEQAALIDRLAEVTSILNGKSSTKQVTHVRHTWPDNFNLQAYAMGLIFEKPDIEVTELAHQLGVSRSTIYSPQWVKVADTLQKRKRIIDRPSHTNLNLDYQKLDDDEQY